MRCQYENVEYEAGSYCRPFWHQSNYTPLHLHRELELLWVMEGSVDLFCRKREHHLEAGDLVVIGCYEIHAIYPHHNDRASIAGMQILPDFCEAFYPELLHTCWEMEQFFRPELLPVRERIQACMERMRSAVQQQPEPIGLPFVIHAESNQFLYEVLNGFTGRVDGNKAIFLKDRVRIDRIMEYVTTHYNCKIVLRDIAQQENMNVYYLSHFFKDKTGMNLKEYITTVRLKKAAQCLLETEDKIVDILYGCGFVDPKGFYRCFKEKFGCTPTAYRRTYQMDWLSETGTRLGGQDIYEIHS